MTFRRRVTHLRPHFDEAVALWLVVREGERVFPGAMIAPIVFWPAGPRTPDSRPAEEYHREGWLLIGVGGGQYDEHPNGMRARRHGECAATLIAKDLGVREHPRYRAVLDYALGNDASGKHSRWAIATAMNSLQYFYKDIEVLEWVQIALQAYASGANATPNGSVATRVDASAMQLGLRAEQVKFLRAHAEEFDAATTESRDPFDVFTLFWKIENQRGEEAANEWLSRLVQASANEWELNGAGMTEVRKAARIETIRTAGGRTVRMCSIQSNNPLVGQIARREKSVGCEIVVVQNSSGNVVVFTRQGSMIPLHAIAMRIRIAERRASGYTGPALSRDELMREGSVPGAENWHFTGWALLNGALTNPYVPPTRLALERILYTIRGVVSQTR